MPRRGRERHGRCSLCRARRLPRRSAGVRARGPDRTGTGERNFLPFIPWLAQRTAVDDRFRASIRIEAIGINTPDELAAGRSHLAGGGRDPHEPTLSIVIPAYNEERFIGTLLEQIQAVDLQPLGFGTEIIVVDDCSTDRTAEIVAAVPGVRAASACRRMAARARAVRAGHRRWRPATTLIIQDADLEYDPQDYVPMMRALLDRHGDIVYGSRYLGRGRHAEPVAGRVSRRPQPEPGLPAFHRHVSDRHRYRAQAVSRARLCRLDLRTSGLRAGSRDHRAKCSLAA